MTYQGKIAGAALLLSLLSIAVGLSIVVAQGRLHGLAAGFRGAEPRFTAYVQAIAPSPTDPDVIVVGIELGAVVRSTDGGETWQAFRLGEDVDCRTSQNKV